ncbi:MAG: outer membrane protein TolC [Saprospiraceae bacterium]|jgi:outer membrane protein TolC
MTKALAFLFILFATVGHTQSDTATLTYDEYLYSVLTQHPLAKQADLKLTMAKAEMLAAKGNFDPKLTSNWSQKNFKDKLYYRIFESKLKVPTRLGIDVVGGYENTEGDFLNSENKTDKLGLWNIGVEANLLQGLITNERRTALQQARIYQDIAENQRQLMLNEIVLSASDAYLEWQKYFARETVVQENIEIANTYFINTRTSFENGEKTAMDTLEAFILAQDAIGLLQKNETKLTKARQKLENFLWLDNLPIEIQNTTQPESVTSPIFEISADLLLDKNLNQNPIIAEKLNKESYYQVEQKLKREKLKPKLKAKYNPLLATTEESIAPNFSANNYKWGFDFSMPLLLRSERANVQKGEIKLQEIALDIQNKRNELQNKIENSRAQQVILVEQIALQTRNTEGYRLLLEGENDKFLYGESSVFLLNKRQEKYLNGRLKLIDLRVKLQREFLDYLYYTNALIEE